MINILLHTLLVTTAFAGTTCYSPSDCVAPEYCSSIDDGVIPGVCMTEPKVYDQDEIDEYKVLDPVPLQPLPEDTPPLPPSAEPIPKPKLIKVKAEDIPEEPSDVVIDDEVKEEDNEEPAIPEEPIEEPSFSNPDPNTESDPKPNIIIRAFNGAISATKNAFCFFFCRD